MAQDNTHESAKMAGIAVASAAMGAAMAVLLTPRSGREVRHKLADKMRKTAEKGEELADKTDTLGE